MSAAEARDGAFVYRDAFFVEIGIGKRHTRASVTELKDLLLPKKGSVASDQVAHWFEAQLVHYGLPRTKDKSAAKLRLIDAINSKTLKVPNDVLKVEADLKKEYAAIQRKSKSASKGDNDSSATTGKKRKATTVGSTPDPASTRFSVKFGDFSFEAEQIPTIGGSSTTAKKAKSSTSSPSQKKKEPKKSTAPKPSAVLPPTKAPPKPAKAAEKPVKLSSPVGFTKDRSPRPYAQSSSPAKNAPRFKNTARKSQAREPNDRPLYPSESDTEGEDEPPPYSEYDSYNPYSSSAKSNVIQISGSYTPITTGYLLPAPAELSFCFSNARSQLFGSFTIGTKQGLIRVDDFGDARKEYSLQWRAEDTETGHLSFRRDNDGWLQFDGEGNVTICLNRLIDGEDVQFDGYREGRESYGVPRKEQMINGMIQEWDGFVNRAYRR